MIKKQQTYSIDQAKLHLYKYLDISAQRLRTRLRAVWKKQSSFRPKVYDKAAN